MRILIALASLLFVGVVQATERPRAREAGVVIGTMPTGARNAIVDVPGVRVGHATVIEGDSVRTGVTAILPHGGDLYAERVPAALFVANGYGKLLGVTQLRELGELETPILLTCTLCVWKAADAMADWLAYGLEDALSETPELGVVRKHKTVSGLIKYQPKGEPSDWAAAAKEILAHEKPDVIVVMLGLHDRTSIREAEKKEKDEKADKISAGIARFIEPATDRIHDRAH